MLYEHWGEADNDGESSEIFIAADAPQHAWLTSDRRLLWTVEAASWDDALALYYERIGGEPDRPHQEGRYERNKMTPIERHLADAANRHAFTFRPWKLGGLRLTDEELVQRVQEEIAEQGSWSDFAEMAMGSGKSVRIDLTEFDGVPAYRVSAGYGITVQASYLTLGRALDMAALFADVAWEIVTATSWRDVNLVTPEP